MIVDRDDRRRGLRVVFRAAIAVIAIGSATAAGSHAASQATNSKASAIRLAQFPGGPNAPGVGQPGIPTVPGLPNPNQLPNGKLPERQLPGRQLPPRDLPDAKLPSNDLPYKQSEEDKQKAEEKERDDADSLTRELTIPTQPRPQQPAQPPFPGTQTRDGDRGLTPPEEQPPIASAPRPPTIYGEEIDGDNPCCGIVGNQIFYPVTRDPQEYKPVQFATNDRRTLGYNVMPHDGGFIETASDMVLPSVGIDGSVVRTYRSDVNYEAGGLIGDGWDFNWNKRIVPVFTRVTGTGLGVETVGADTALFFYDGTGHVDRYASTHSEQRRVANFGATYAAQKQFFAWVTTYQSPPHEFLEIERYIVYEATDHPFKEHPDVKDELGESIFYVVRLKNGTQYIFNCRGQMIYVFDKHHNKTEFRYGGPMNPLTHSPVVSEMIDTANRRWSVKITTIGTAPISTNFECMFVSGVLPIPRVEEITDPAGRKLVVHYTFQGIPTIDWVTQEFPNDIGLSTDYSYEADNRLTDIVRPKEFSGQKRASVHNDYDGGGRVVRQRHDAQTFSLAYNNGVDVTNSSGTRTRYEMEKLDDTFVVSSIAVTGAGGISSTNRYQHNPYHQITSETLPRGNRIEYLYDAGNEPVTLGRVRDWADRNLTYENNLSLGNLLGVRMVSDKPQSRVVFNNGQAVQQSASGGQQEEILEALSYEPLFNEKELFIDKRGNQTEYSFNYNLDYGHLGVPVRIQPPAVTQPGGGKVEVPVQVFTYSPRGEPLSVTAGKRSVSNIYDARGWLTRRTREDGAATATEYRNDGQVLSVTTAEGYRITYRRNGRGLVETSTLDPGPNEIRTLYRYDLHGNALEMRKDVRDLFPANGASGFNVPPRDFGQNVTSYEFDQYDRPTKETFRGYDGITVDTARSYDANNRELSVTTPSPAGPGTVTRSYAYDPLGRKVSETIGGRATRYEYDANGNQTAEISPIGRRTSYFYDGFDRKIATADHAGGLMRQTLDKSGNAIEISFEGETGNGNSRGLLQETKSDFDEFDKPIRVSRNSFVNGNSVTESYYDGNHDLVREKAQGGAFTRYEYDPMGRRTLREDPLGNITRYTYSGNGFLTSMEEVEKETTFANSGRQSHPDRADLHDDDLERQVRQPDLARNARRTNGAHGLRLGRTRPCGARRNREAYGQRIQFAWAADCGNSGRRDQPHDVQRGRHEGLRDVAGRRDALDLRPVRQRTYGHELGFGTSDAKDL